MQTNNFTDVQCRLSISVILDAKCKPATSMILGAKCKPATSMIFVSRHLQICSFAHVDCVLHGFSNFASFSLRFSLLLLLTFWRHDRHHRRSLLLHQLLRPEIAPAAPAHLPFITSFCHFDCIRTTASTHTHLH